MSPASASAAPHPLLRIGLVGETAAAEARRASLARIGANVIEHGDMPEDVSALDALFVAAPLAERYTMARDAVERGVGVFVEWPPAPAMRNVQALSAAAEEAGVPVCVSRPLRYHPALAALERPAQWVVLRRVVPAGTSVLAGHALADLADLCLFLVQGAALTRLDAQAVRDATRAPRALGFNLRFQNGAYAQAATHAGPATSLHLHAHAATAALDADLYTPTDLDAARDAETRGFLDALASGTPPAVTLLDALQTLRLVERLWMRLR